MQLTVPVETMVPISRFGRGTASAEFAKVADDSLIQKTGLTCLLVLMVV